MTSTHVTVSHSVVVVLSSVLFARVVLEPKIELLRILELSRRMQEDQTDLCLISVVVVSNSRMESYSSQQLFSFGL